MSEHDAEQVRRKLLEATFFPTMNSHSRTRRSFPATLRGVEICTEFGAQSGRFFAFEEEGHVTLNRKVRRPHQRSRGSHRTERAGLSATKGGGLLAWPRPEGPWPGALPYPRSAALVWGWGPLGLGGTSPRPALFVWALGL